MIKRYVFKQYADAEEVRASVGYTTAIIRRGYAMLDAEQDADLIRELGGEVAPPERKKKESVKASKAESKDGE